MDSNLSRLLFFIIGETPILSPLIIGIIPIFNPFFYSKFLSFHVVKKLLLLYTLILIINSRSFLTAKNRKNSDFHFQGVDKLWISLFSPPAFHATKTGQPIEKLRRFLWSFASGSFPHFEMPIDDSDMESFGKLSYQNHPPKTGEIPSLTLGGFAIRELTESLLRFARTCNRPRKCQKQAAPWRIARRSHRLASVRLRSLWGQGAKKARNFAAAHAFFALPQFLNSCYLKGQTA